MNKIRFLKPLWWLLHVIAIAVIFWLGHFVSFPSGSKSLHPTNKSTKTGMVQTIDNGLQAMRVRAGDRYLKI